MFGVKHKGTMQSQNKTKGVGRLRTHAKSRGFPASLCRLHLCFLSVSVSFRPLARPSFHGAGNGAGTKGPELSYSLEFGLSVLV